MKKKLTNNLGLKLLSLFLAIFLWFIITNINDPIKTETFLGIPITMINRDYVTDKGKVVQMEDTPLANITVTAKRSIIEDINEGDITANVNLAEVDTEVDMASTMLKVRCSVNRYVGQQLESIEADPEYLHVRVENQANKQIVIQTDVTGTPAEGYVLSRAVTDQNMMSVSGPESVVNKIAGAKVTLDVDGLSSSINIKRNVVLLDRDGNVMDDDMLTKSIESVIVSASILETKEVPLIFSVTGEPAEGYRFTGIIDSDPARVLVAGRSAYIRSTYRIEIPESELDLTDLRGDLVKTVDITPYLSDELILADDKFDGKVSVVAHVEQILEKDILVDSDAVSFRNVPEGYEVRTAPEDEGEGEAQPPVEWTVTVHGMQKDLDALQEENIIGYIDIEKLLLDQDAVDSPEGAYRAEVTWELPDGVTADEGARLEFVIESIEDEQETERE